MPWTLLPTDYTDAVWSGLKRYTMIDNQDGTMSFQDMTIYTNKEKSFFGASDANRMNQALNTIMSMVENGSDLYEDFQNYFAEQKELFEDSADSTQQEFVQYVDALKSDSDNVIEQIKLDYELDISTFKHQQETDFTNWFDGIKGQLNGDVAGQLLLMIQDTDDRLSAHTDDQAIHVTQEEKDAWNEAASGASPTALYASTGDLPSATADSQATKGKALVRAISTGTEAGTEVLVLSLGNRPLAYGTYSCVVRLKSSYSGSAGTNFLTLKVEHVSGDAPTTLGTAAIRDSDVYRTDNYCVFAMGFDFLGPWAEGDSFRLTVEAAAAVEATVSLDYVAVNLAGATLLTL